MDTTHEKQLLIIYHLILKEHVALVAEESAAYNTLESRMNRIEKIIREKLGD